MREKKLYNDRTSASWLAFLLGILVFLLGILICIKPVCSATIKQVYVGDAISERILHVVYLNYPELKIEQWEALEKVVKGDSGIRKIVTGYLDAIAEAYDDPEDFREPDMEKEFDELNEKLLAAVEQETGLQMSELEKTKLIAQFQEKEEQVQNILERLPSYIRNFGSYTHTALRLYHFLTSQMLLAGIVLLTGITGGAIIYLKRHDQKWLTSFGIVMIINGVMIGLFISAVIKGIAYALTNRLIGRTSEIEILAFYLVGGILLVGGIALIMLQRFLQRNRDKKMNIGGNR